MPGCVRNAAVLDDSQPKTYSLRTGHQFPICSSGRPYCCTIPRLIASWEDGLRNPSESMRRQPIQIVAMLESAAERVGDRIRDPRLVLGADGAVVCAGRKQSGLARHGFHARAEPAQAARHREQRDVVPSQRDAGASRLSELPPGPERR